MYVFLRRFQLMLRRFFGASHRAMMDSVLGDEVASTVNAIAGVCMACFFFGEHQFPWQCTISTKGTVSVHISHTARYS